MSSDILKELAKVIEQRKGCSPQESYVACLFATPDKMLEKIGEEAVETVLAAKNGDKNQIVYEAADLWFHTLVMLAHFDLSPEDVLRELQRRFGTSGHAEKAARK